MKKSIPIIIMIGVILCLAAESFAGGITKTTSAKELFLQNGLTLEKYFSRKLYLAKKDDLTNTDVYEYGTKSPMKAFGLSLLVPGAGQYYVEASRIKTGVFLGADILLWSGYLVYHHKGANGEKDYRSFADQHYLWQTYDQWWWSLPEPTRNHYSHSLPWDQTLNQPIRNREYYENIGKYDQFQVGWDDVGLNNPPDSTNSVTYGNRLLYLNMRKKANDYFSNATTMAMISIANHIISAFDAAIGAKKFNRGGKQYSMALKAKRYNGKTIPYLSLAMKF